LKSPLPIISYRAEKLLELGGNCVLAGPGVPVDVQDVRLATDLAVLNVALARAAGRIDLGFVPLTAARALKSGQHSSESIVKQTAATHGDRCFIVALLIEEVDLCRR